MGPQKIVVMPLAALASLLSGFQSQVFPHFGGILVTIVDRVAALNLLEPISLKIHESKVRDAPFALLGRRRARRTPSCLDSKSPNN